MLEEARDPDRCCEAPGCLTTLSRYNTDYLCFRHADEATRARFERRLSNETRPTRYRPTTEEATRMLDRC